MIILHHSNIEVIVGKVQSELLVICQGHILHHSNIKVIVGFRPSISRPGSCSQSLIKGYRFQIVDVDCFLIYLLWLLKLMESV
jgi:hypothetical protein